MYLLSGYVLCAGIWAAAANMGLSPRILQPWFVNGVSVHDKVIHFLVVGGFAVVLARAYGKLGWRAGLCWVAAMATAALLATFEELTNLLTPYRNFSILDLAADYSGILLLTGLVWGIERGVRSAAGRPASRGAEPTAAALGMFSEPA